MDASKQNWQATLQRWQAARLIDSETAAKIVAFEAQPPDTERLQWPLLIALAFGGIALGAGILLLIAAHWDSLGTAARSTAVISMVIVLHGAGIATRDSPRFRGLFHVLGSVAFGAAIFLLNEIFHRNSAWQHEMSLWAATTAVAWWLLRDTGQIALLALLAPVAVGGEYIEYFANRSQWGDKWMAVWIAMIALDYLGATLPGAGLQNEKLPEASSPARAALVWMGGIALLPALAMAGFSVGLRETPPLEHLVAALLIATVLALLLRRKDSWINLLLLTLTLAISVARSGTNTADVPILLYLLYVVGAAGLVWWGVRENHRERVNFGVAGFALTVLCFYISNIFDKFGRAESLIGFGVFLLGGGWVLERVRRRLVANLSISMGEPK